jgi:hypothetical protein
LKGGSLYTSMFYNIWEDLLLGIDEVKDQMLQKLLQDYDMIHVKMNL